MRRRRKAKIRNRSVNVVYVSGQLFATEALKFARGFTKNFQPYFVRGGSARNGIGKRYWKYYVVRLAREDDYDVPVRAVSPDRLLTKEQVIKCNNFKD